MACSDGRRSEARHLAAKSDLERGRVVPGRRPRERARHHKAQGQAARQHHHARPVRARPRRLQLGEQPNVSRRFLPFYIVLNFRIAFEQLYSFQLFTMENIPY